MILLNSIFDEYKLDAHLYQPQKKSVLLIEEKEEKGEFTFVK